MAVLSPLITLVLFGSLDNVWWVCLSASALVFMGFQNGHNTIMQATRYTGFIAKATMTGAIGGLVLVVGCFFLLGKAGIVQAMIMGYFAFWLSSRHFERKIPFEKSDDPSKKEFIAHSKPVLKLGIVLMGGTTLVTFFTFLLSSFINRFGSMGEVGMYQSANSMIGQGMVIVNVLLASDFFPRLSAVHTDALKMRQTIKQQADILFYIVPPIAVLIIALADQIVWLLLSPEFAPVSKLLQIMSIALVFRIMWTTMSFVILAEGRKKEFFIFDALIGNGVNFLMAVAGFYWCGLDGLAYAFLAGSLFMVGLLWMVTRTRCKATIASADMFMMFLFGLVMAATFFIARTCEGSIRHLLLACVCIAIISFCLFRINKKTDIFVLIKNKFKR
jgi:O-antigen/teichoic acid export membrane protein